MSGIFANLKNKISYQLHTAVTDPDANQFAADQAAEPVIPEVLNDDDADYFDMSPTTGQDPNTFDMTRALKKVGNQIIRIMKKGFFPLIALILSMYVANEMIVY